MRMSVYADVAVYCGVRCQKRNIEDEEEKTHTEQQQQQHQQQLNVMQTHKHILFEQANWNDVTIAADTNME